MDNDSDKLGGEDLDRTEALEPNLSLFEDWGDTVEVDKRPKDNRDQMDEYGKILEDPYADYVAIEGGTPFQFRSRLKGGESLYKHVNKGDPDTEGTTRGYYWYHEFTLIDAAESRTTVTLVNKKNETVSVDYRVVKRGKIPKNLEYLRLSCTLTYLEDEKIEKKIQVMLQFDTKGLKFRIYFKKKDSKLALEFKKQAANGTDDRWVLEGWDATITSMKAYQNNSGDDLWSQKQKVQFRY